jgi:hypothetical protein
MGAKQTPRLGAPTSEIDPELGLSKAMALAHTGVCQGQGGALLVSRFRRPKSLTALLVIDYWLLFPTDLSRLRSNLYRLRRRVTNRRMPIGTVAANS